MHNARNMREIRTLGECLLKENGVMLHWKNDTKLSGDESIDEGLYNELEVWKSISGS